MISTQYIKLNMTPFGALPVLYCSRYDIGRPLGLVVHNGSEPVDLDTYTATIEATRTDKTPITAAVTTDGNIGVFVTTAEMTNEEDRYFAKLVLFDSGSNRVASLAFVMAITPATMDENAESIEEDKSLYQQYTGTVQALIAEIREDLTQLKNEMSRINIAGYADGNLTSANFAQAFTAALAVSNLLYIPAGTWDFDIIGTIAVTQPVDIIADENAIFTQVTSPEYLFDFSNTVRWKGGTFRIGPNRASTESIESAERGLLGGAFRFKESTNSTVEGLRVDWCKLPSVINAFNTYGFTVRNCTMTDCIEACVRFFEHCVNTVVENCHFENIKIPTNHPNVYYCYAVGTGLVSLSDLNIIPPDNLIYHNNVVINSEDCGLDTHGATNVLIENNIITNCSTAITAYNDSRRVTRPDGWEMSNVIIRNNTCVSNRKYAGSDAHSYIIISGVNKEQRDSHNYIIENNIFSGVTDNYPYLVSIDRMQRVVVRNNVFDGQGIIQDGILVLRSDKIEIDGNFFKNFTNVGLSVYIGASVTTKSNTALNTPSVVKQTREACSYVYAPEERREMVERMLKCMDSNTYNGFISINRKTGITLNPTYTLDTQDYVCTLSNGVLTSESILPFFTDLRVTIDGNPYFVTEILSDFSVNVRPVSTETADGTYTVSIDTAALATYVASPTPYSGDLNNMPRGVGYITGKVLNEPGAWETWGTPYVVYCVPRRRPTEALNTQIALLADNIFIRSQGINAWFAWKRLAVQS